MNIQSYNKIARTWAENRSQSFVSQLVIDFAGRVKPGGKILDIGCGSGLPVTAYLCDECFRVTGIDAASEMIAIAKETTCEKASFILCDFFDFDTDETFDGIIAFDSFFHFPKEKQAGIYAKLHRLLNPEGWLLFTHGGGEEAGEITGEMFGETFYYSKLSTREIRRLLLDSGFEIFSMEENYIERDIDRELVVLAGKI